MRSLIEPVGFQPSSFAKNRKPGDGSSIDAGATGDKTGNKLGLSKTGAAVLGLSGVAVALAAAGIALTLQRKRQA